eukprot:SAG31_NODE_754_length_12324_cov_3.930061_1_plen_70_part_00
MPTNLVACTGTVPQSRAAADRAQFGVWPILAGTCTAVHDGTGTSMWITAGTIMYGRMVHVLLGGFWSVL